MPEFELEGCPFQPLGAYLKALAVLRLASQQEPNARGYWGDRYFVLRSDFSAEDLVRFFLERYRPTPLLAPWNGGSGFYPKDRKVGMDAIRAATNNERFVTYRSDLEAAIRIVNESGTEKGASKSKEDERRTQVLRRCRNELSDACVEWLDAAIAIAADETRAFAPILGTGGNEGRLDYTNNFMENVTKLLLRPDKKTLVAALLENALFDRASGGLQDIAVGQYDPGRCGGFNQGNGIEEKSIANPWNAVLTLEGAVAWAGGIYRRQGVAYRSFLCSPFTVRPSAVGFGSAAKTDEETARAEIWTPLWDKPARFREIASVLREGRAAVGGKAAQTGLEFAEAAASLGVDRAISGFVRYSLVKRRGDSYIALPAGRFAAGYRSTADRVREIVPFVEAAQRAVLRSNNEAPNSWSGLKRAIEEAIFNALLYGGTDTLLEVASAFGAMHKWLLLRESEVFWRRRLKADWVEKSASSSGEVEVRIAAALAGIPGLAGNVRAGSAISWSGRDLSARMLATVRRRTLNGESFRSTYFAWPSDVAAFLDHRTDDELIENMMFAFLLVEKSKPVRPPANDVNHCRAWPAYCVLKQLFATGSEEMEGEQQETRLGPNLAVPAFLAAGRVKEAIELGIHRLKVSGVRLGLNSGWDSEEGTRLGAALLIPVADLDGLRKLVEAPEREFAEA